MICRSEDNSFTDVDSGNSDSLKRPEVPSMHPRLMASLVAEASGIEQTLARDMVCHGARSEFRRNRFNSLDLYASDYSYEDYTREDSLACKNATKSTCLKDERSTIISL